MSGWRRQGLRFLVAGACATGTDALLFTLLTLQGVDPRAANVTSYALSAILAFWLHRHWTFGRGDGAIAGQAIRFTAMVGLGLALSTAMIWMLVPLVGPFPAKLAAIGGTLTLNFLVSRRLVFAPSATVHPVAEGPRSNQ